MSDSKLRELERRWRETGSVDDEAAYLRERVRVGDLTQERLELAAYCGHEGARSALGLGADSPPAPADLMQMLKGLRRWGPRQQGRALSVIVDAALPVWRDVCHDAEERELVEGVADALKQWSEHSPDQTELRELVEQVQAAESATWHPSSVAVVLGADSIISDNEIRMGQAVMAGLSAARWSNAQALERVSARVCLAALADDGRA